MTAHRVLLIAATACGYMALGSVFANESWAVCLFGALFFILLGGSVVLQPSAIEGFAQAELNQRWKK